MITFIYTLYMFGWGLDFTKNTEYLYSDYLICIGLDIISIIITIVIINFAMM